MSGQKREFTIAVAKDFSRYPGGRFRDHGKHSGEAFRDDILAKALKNHQYVVVDLDGTYGYGSSFLDEVFGGLIRKGIIRFEEVPRRLAIKSVEDPSYAYEAEQSMREAAGVSA